MKIDTLLIDSNVWVALLHETDSQHARAQKIFGLLPGGGVVIHEYVIVEVCTVLQMKAGKAVAAQFLENVFSNQDIDIIFAGEAALREAGILFSTQKGSLSLVDCVLVVCSKLNPILTFDKKLENFINRFTD